MGVVVQLQEMGNMRGEDLLPPSLKGMPCGLESQWSHPKVDVCLKNLLFISGSEGKSQTYSWSHLEPTHLIGTAFS